MHSIAKILTKLVATRIAPELHSLVSACQSAFIKRRSIQDNFLFVRNVVKEAHCKKKPLIFLKLDFTKAFDTVRWDYLLQVLHAFGFSSRWCDMLSLMLASSTSRVLLNGCPGKPFLHKKGVRQGDLLAPMLFYSSLRAPPENLG